MTRRIILKRGVLIGTGGTIASRGSSDRKPELSAQDLLSDVHPLLEDCLQWYNEVRRTSSNCSWNPLIAHQKHPLIPQDGTIKVEMDALQLFGDKGLDSSKMLLEQRIEIAQECYRQLQSADFVVVTHGTDTMATTLAVLAFALRGLQKPVIVTGSNNSWDHDLPANNNEAKRNLYQAILAGTLYLPGVYALFDTKILLGARCKKTHFSEKSDNDVFESVNFPVVGILDYKFYGKYPPHTTWDWFLFSPFLNPHAIFLQKGPFRLHDRFEPDVSQITLSDSATADFERICQKPPKGLVIGVYGAGGLPDYIEPHIKRLTADGVVLAVYSSARMPIDPNLYEANRLIKKYGMIPLLDMQPEVAQVKLMYALGRCRSRKEVRTLMTKNLAGEISTNGLQTYVGNISPEEIWSWHGLETIMKVRTSHSMVLGRYAAELSDDLGVKMWIKEFHHKWDEMMTRHLYQILKRTGYGITN